MTSYDLAMVSHKPNETAAMLTLRMGLMDCLQEQALMGPGGVCHLARGPHPRSQLLIPERFPALSRKQVTPRGADFPQLRKSVSLLCKITLWAK